MFKRRKKNLGLDDESEKKVSSIALWDDLGSSYIYRYRSDHGINQDKNMYADLVGLYSGKDRVTYVYSIDGYGMTMPIAYASKLREKCGQGVCISFITPYEGYKIDWESRGLTTKIKVWETLADDSPEITDYNLAKTLGPAQQNAWKRNSLSYLIVADLDRQRSMFKTTRIMLVTGARGRDFDESILAIEESCKRMKIKVSRVTADIPKYLEAFSPFSNQHNKVVDSQCGHVALTDEILARLSTHDQGQVGKGGIYWGTDIFSHFPCFKMIKNTTESAENWLITAETRGGKSYFMKGILLQLLAQNQYNATINDVEGFEYIPIGNYLSQSDKVAIIQMGEGTGAYYDPVEITLTGDEELDKSMYSLCTSCTVAIFKCILGANAEESGKWADIVIDDAASITYNKRGVDSTRMETWKNTEGLILRDVYDVMKSLKTNSRDQGLSGSGMTNSHASAMYENPDDPNLDTSVKGSDVNSVIATNKNYQHALDLCIASASKYFEPDGLKASVFSKRITLNDITEAKLVICSFGMAGRSEQSVDKTQMSLMQLYAAQISHLRSIFSKSQGKYNIKLWEEFQRWGKFPDAAKIINTAITGGGKLGDINIIVTNDVGSLLHDDKFGIFSNLTSVAIGCIPDASIRHELCSRLSLETMEDELRILAENNKDLSAFVDGDTLLQNPYSKAFLLGLDRTAYTIARMSLPAGLRDSALMRTGISLAHVKSHEEEVS